MGRRQVNNIKCVVALVKNFIPQGGATTAGSKKHDTNRSEESTLKQTGSNWKNFLRRVCSSIILILLTALVIFMGSIGLTFLVIAIQVTFYWEIIVAFSKMSHGKFPLFKPLAIYMLITGNYFMYGEIFRNRFPGYVERSLILSHQHHRIICFFLYMLGNALFLIDMLQKPNRIKFGMHSLIHMLFWAAIMPSFLFIKCLFEGIFWLMLPVFLILINDICAYVCGKLWGKTPLIQLSPKKTVEGFIGAVVGTVTFGVFMARMLSNYGHFTCPTEYDAVLDRLVINTNCTRSPVFMTQNYCLFGTYCFSASPAMFHSLSISIFASNFTPFSGFFLSGLKRWLEIKNFSNLIPGHGGIVDRFDCQPLMPLFLEAYIFTFLENNYDLNYVFGKIVRSSKQNQVKVFELLQKTLVDRNLTIV